MKYPKLRELKEAIKALIKGPYTSKFPYQPHKPYDSFKGKPEFHQDDCVGCAACLQVCPSRAISMEDVNGKRRLTIRWDLCIFCGQCQVNCLTEKGIILSQEFDLATTGNRAELKQTIEKELVLCDCCQEVIAPYDQILWVIKRIGPFSFANASLVLFHLKNFTAIMESSLRLNAKQENLALKEKSLPHTEPEFMRDDRLKLLCSRCRREAILKS